MSEHDLEVVIAWMQQLPYWALTAFCFANAYVENIFPPSPSDVFLVFIGTLVGVGVIDFPTALVSSTAGSILGFDTMFLIGRRVDRSVVESGRCRFIPVNAVHKVEQWFRRWGYAVIVVNRFLSGTRAVIAFLAGMSAMRLSPSLLYCGISALFWNGLILFAGQQLGKNWRLLDQYLRTYSTIVTLLLIGLVLMFVVTRVISAKRKTDDDGSLSRHD